MASNNNEYLFGKLNKPTSKNTYVGGTTESLTINVDNENRIITGEVRWDSALGTVAHKAYPGDKGARNYAKIQELTQELHAEIEDTAKHKKYVLAELEILARDLVRAQNEFVRELNEEHQFTVDTETKLETELDKEIKRAIAAEKKLIDDLTKEIIARKSEATNSLNLLNDLSIKTLEFEQLIQQKLNDEIQRAMVSESDIRKLIFDESQRAQTSEQNLENKITVVESNIANNVDKALSEKLAEEQAAREKADAQLQNDLESEKNTRASANVVLQTEVTDIKTNISSINESVSDVTKTVQKNTADISNLRTSVNSINSSVQEFNTSISSVRDDVDELSDDFVNLADDVSNGYQEVQTQISTINSQLAKLEELDQFTSSAEKLKQSVENLTKQTTENSISIQSIKNDVAITNNSIETLSGKLNLEINRSEAVDVEIREQCNALIEEINRLKELTNDVVRLNNTQSQVVSDIRSDVTTLNNRLTTEINQRDTQWSSIQSSMDAEHDRAISVEKTLFQECVDLRDTLVEVRNRLAADIKDVENDSIKRDDILFTSISDEFNRRVAAITLINSRLEKIEDALSAQTTRIIDIQQDVYDIEQSILYINLLIVSVQNDIDEVKESVVAVNDRVDKTSLDVESVKNQIQVVDDKVNSKQLEIDRLQVEIDELSKTSSNHTLADESINRSINELKLIDENLQSQIDELKTTDEYVVVLPTTETTQVFTQTGDTLGSLSVSTEPLENAVVQRDAVGNIILSESTTRFTTNAAVSKTYVDSLVEEKTSQLINQLEQMLAVEFIDGGNAPIQ